MFKLIIAAAAFEALTPEHKALYKKDDASGNYKLDVDPEDLPDVTGLRTKNEELLREKKEEQRKREAAELERAKKDGDLVALETSWKTRLDTETGSLKDNLTKREKQLESLTVGRAASELASELAIAGSAKALLPHIERRLKMEADGDEIKVRVLDSAGKPSAMTLDQLKDEFRNDPAFGPLIVANKANGGGADGGKNNGGGAPDGTKMEDMSEADRTKLHRENPTKYNQLRQEMRNRQNARRDR